MLVDIQKLLAPVGFQSNLNIFVSVWASVSARKNALKLKKVSNCSKKLDTQKRCQSLPKSVVSHFHHAHKRRTYKIV